MVWMATDWPKSLILNSLLLFAFVRLAVKIKVFQILPLDGKKGMHSKFVIAVALLE